MKNVEKREAKSEETRRGCRDTFGTQISMRANPLSPSQVESVLVDLKMQEKPCFFLLNKLIPRE